MHQFSFYFDGSNFIWLVKNDFDIIDRASTENSCKQENRSTTETTVEEWLRIPLLAAEGIVFI